MVLTIMDTTSACRELTKVDIAHVSIFEHNQISLAFISNDEQLKLMKVFLKNFVKFECQGHTITLIQDNCLRVRFRFDS